MKNVINAFKLEFDAQVERIEAIKNDMRQIVKSDNVNSKQIIELEQSEGIYKIISTYTLVQIRPTGY